MTNSFNLRKSIYVLAGVFFVLIIFLPAVFILSNVFVGGIVFNWVILKAVLVSLAIGAIVLLIDILFGLPLAWILTRSQSKLATIVDSLIDLSLVMPTAALGFSIYLYWGERLGLARIFGIGEGLFDRGMIMIVLLHVVFTIPYIIRSISAAIRQIEDGYTEAAATLGAYPFTSFRTISLPLFRDGIINGSILAFTRSLSETGATMMVAGLVSTAPVLVVSLKNSGELSQAIGLSTILISIAIMILIGAKAILGQKTISLDHVYPRLERGIGKLTMPRNILLGLFFIFIIFLPTIFIVLYSLGNWEIAIDQSIIKSIFITFGIAAIVTIINLLFALPLAYLIARSKGAIGKIFDSMNEIVLLVPTSALGLSLVLFWNNFLSFEYIILILTHLSFSFPLLLKPLVSAFRDISIDLESAAYSLGANSKQVLRTILLPLIMPAIIAGCIMAFMRSLSETGATLAVSRDIETVPILIVNLVESSRFGQAAFISTLLFAVALVLLLVLKFITHRKNN